MSRPEPSLVNRFFARTLWVPYLAVGFVLAGVLTVYCTQFVKISLGPLYIVELAFLICFGYFLILGLPIEVGAFIRASWPPIPFFLWGCVLLLIDLATLHFHKPPTFNRVIQHSLLFVYPLMWTFAGGWLLATSEVYTRRMFYLLLIVNILPNLWGQIAWNIALGPLVGIPFVVSIRELVKSSGRKAPVMVMMILMGLLFYLPFYRMLGFGFQRTYLLDFIIMLLTMPLLAYCTFPEKKMAGVLYGIFFMIFILAMARSTVRQLTLRESRPIPAAPVSTPSLPSPTPSSSTMPVTAPPPPSQDSVKHLLIQRLEHAEDRPIEGNNKPFQMRTRKFMWQTALSDFKQRPWIGVGFIPEIPSFLDPNTPNTGDYEKKDSPPVSGPHNSYLSIFVRMGVPGMILFFFPAGMCLSQFLRYLRKTGSPFFDLLLFYIVINGCLYSLFNVGLESPARAFPFWLAFGVLLARSKNDRILIN